MLAFLHAGLRNGGSLDTIADQFSYGMHGTLVRSITFPPCTPLLCPQCSRGPLSPYSEANIPSPCRINTKSRLQHALGGRGGLNA